MHPAQYRHLQQRLGVIINGGIQFPGIGDDD
jgi:hypothetical protein